MSMKRISVVIIVCCISQFCFAQDSLKKKSNFFYLNIGISENVPFTKRYSETQGSKNNGYYSSFSNARFIAFGYYATIGYGIPLNNKLCLMSDISYFNLKEKQQKNGQYSGADFPPYGFFGYHDIEKTFHNIGISVLASVKTKKILFDNGIGLSYLVKQNSTDYSYDFISESSTIYNNNRKDYYFNVFSIHKVGFDIVQNKISFYLGVNMNYNNYLIRSINPHISIQFKI